MSTEPTKKIFELEVYQDNSTVTVDLPVELVMRFNQLLMEFIPFKDEDHFLEVMKNITDKKFDDPFAYHVSTILFLLNKVEESARSQGKLQWVEYNAETQEKKVIEKNT
jgi:hypothetical protein